MSKFGNLISQAKGESMKEISARKEQSGNTENQKSGGQIKPKTEEKGRAVNLSIKVPENLRRHWVAEAKRQGTSITAEVTDALNKKFGLPDYQ